MNQPPLRPAVPVSPGPDGATLAAVAGLAHDPPGARCAACESTTHPRTRRRVDSFLIMLCDDSHACFERFRS